MLKRDFDVVQLAGVDLGESGFNIQPPLLRSSVVLSQLSRRLSENQVQQGYALVEGERPHLGIVLYRRLELLRFESLVVAPDRLPLDRDPVMELLEVVPQLFPHLVLREFVARIDPRNLAELLVQGVCLLE